MPRSDPLTLTLQELIGDSGLALSLPDLADLQRDGGIRQIQGKLFQQDGLRLVKPPLVELCIRLAKGLIPNGSIPLSNGLTPFFRQIARQLRSPSLGDAIEDSRSKHDEAEDGQEQTEREDALQGFRKGKYEVLVATDIASRGLDIAEVSHVVNYDVPEHPEDYIHRIGRTGRMEHSGDALTLMTAADASHVYSIERFISQKIPRVKLEDFDYKYTALFEEGKPGQKASFPGKARGGRIRGGYSFSPSQRR